MRHAFMEESSDALTGRGIATFRYQFPYFERGSRRPDARSLLLATVQSAVAEATRLAPDLARFAGGKSMGGRMTSLAAAEKSLGVQGIVFFGFPLHPAGRPSSERAEHLSKAEGPLLFVQGTRDKLAELERLRAVTRALGESATLVEIEGADHSFHVLKRSGRTDSEVMAELAQTAATWMLERI
jgi:predicted alpha/beta-hydrolase family hydrolase